MPARASASNSYVSKGAKAVICGLGIDGYALAINGLAGAMIGARADLKSWRTHCGDPPGCRKIAGRIDQDLIRELAHSWPKPV